MRHASLLIVVIAAVSASALAPGASACTEQQWQWDMGPVVVHSDNGCHYAVTVTVDEVGPCMERYVGAAVGPAIVESPDGCTVGAAVGARA